MGGGLNGGSGCEKLKGGRRRRWTLLQRFVLSVCVRDGKKKKPVSLKCEGKISNWNSHIFFFLGQHFSTLAMPKLERVFVYVCQTSRDPGFPPPQAVDCIKRLYQAKIPGLETEEQLCRGRPVSSGL